MIDPISEVWRRSEMLETALKECKSRGVAYANAEHDYKVALAAKITTLEAEGAKQTTIVEKARGSPDVAKLALERDLSKVLYETAQDALLVYRKQIEVLRDQIDREWRNA